MRDISPIDRDLGRFRIDRFEQVVNKLELLLDLLELLLLGFGKLLLGFLWLGLGLLLGGRLLLAFGGFGRGIPPKPDVLSISSLKRL